MGYLGKGLLEKEGIIKRIESFKDDSDKIRLVVKSSLEGGSRLAFHHANESDKLAQKWISYNAPSKIDMYDHINYMCMQIILRHKDRHIFREMQPFI